MEKEELQNIHHKRIPFLHAVLWGVGLLFAIFGSLFLKEESSENILYLYNAYITYCVFLIEASLTFVDIASIYDKCRIKGNVFWILGRLFSTLPLVLLISLIYYHYNCIYIFLAIIGIMSWLKWEVVHINNNMDKFVIEVEGYNFKSNEIK